MAPFHVLAVARWYPSFDDPGRGSFVADHVAALRAAGVEVSVASFDPTGVRGPERTRPERGAAASVALEPALRSTDALSTPTSWGAGAPVARTPVILDGSRRSAGDMVDAHARALVPFGLGVHERRPIDVIHAHTGFPDGLAAARLAARLAVPLLTTEHSSTAPDELADPDTNHLYRTLLAHGRRVVAVSGSLAREIADRLGFEVHEIAVLPNAVPLDRFQPGPTEGRDPHAFLYVGSRKRTKGIETLLRAFAQVRLEDADARLRLVGAPGSPEEEAAWRELAAQLGIGDAVALEDRAERDGVAQAMRESWVFMHASPRETFGMVAVEAIASGLPVAATPSGGVDEIVGRDATLGEIGHGGDADALAAAVRRVLARRGAFDPTRMHERMATSYAAGAVAARTLELYGSLLDEISAGSGRSLARRAADGVGYGADPQRPFGPSVDGGVGTEVIGAPEAMIGEPEGARAAEGMGAAAGMAATGPDATAGSRTAAFEAPLVVGLVRELASRRLDALPPELLAGLTIATLAEPEPRRPQPGRWLEHDPEREYLTRLEALGGPLAPTPAGRLASALRSPRREVERRDLIAHRADVRRRSLDAFLRSAWESAGRPRHVLALDADDVLAVGPLVAPGGTPAPDASPGRDSAGGPAPVPVPVPVLAPGGLRWLADRWDAAGRPTG